MISEALAFFHDKDRHSDKDQTFIRKEMMKESDDTLAELVKMKRSKKKKGSNYFGRCMKITNGSPDEDI